jgi:hypothetical protein
MTDAIAARLPGADSDKVVKVLFLFSQDFDAPESARLEQEEEETAIQDIGEPCNTFFALMSQSGVNPEDVVPPPDFH